MELGSRDLIFDMRAFYGCCLDFGNKMSGMPLCAKKLYKC
jgi:hypothetical protein